jgi:hypothetical protein
MGPEACASDPMAITLHLTPCMGFHNSMERDEDDERQMKEYQELLDMRHYKTGARFCRLLKKLDPTVDKFSPSVKLCEDKDDAPYTPHSKHRKLGYIVCYKTEWPFSLAAESDMSRAIYFTEECYWEEERGKLTRPTWRHSTFGTCGATIQERVSASRRPHDHGRSFFI